MPIRSGIDKWHALWRLVCVVGNIIYIEDTCESGHKSVTNDAEYVTQEIVNYYGKNIRILYKDSMGEWGELVHLDGVFVQYAPVGENIPTAPQHRSIDEDWFSYNED